MLSHVSHTTIVAIQNTASKITPHTKQRAQPSLSSRPAFGNTIGIFLDHSIEYTLCVMSEPLDFNTNYPAKMNPSSAGSLKTLNGARPPLETPLPRFRRLKPGRSEYRNE
jgi:hypothetical protein